MEFSGEDVLKSRVCVQYVLNEPRHKEKGVKIFEDTIPTSNGIYMCMCLGLYGC